MKLRKTNLTNIHALFDESRVKQVRETASLFQPKLTSYLGMEGHSFALKYLDDGAVLAMTALC